METATYQFAKIKQVDIHYDVQGEGYPLVLIHAGIANLNMWSVQVEELSKHFKVIRYDVRGFGQTPDPAGNYTDYEDLRALLDYLDVKQAHVLGISNGGRIALDFVLSYPRYVDKLILVGPRVPGLEIPREFDELERDLEYEEEETAGDIDKQVDILVEVWVDGPNRKAEDVNSDFRQKASELVRHTVELGVGDGEGDIARPVAAGRLGEIEKASLVIIGGEDQPGKFFTGDFLEKNMVQAEQAIIPGTAHLPPMEKPREFNQIVLDFLAK